MGYVTVFSTCYTCNGFMSFNPNKVPSLRINGERQPLCEACANKYNATRKKMGLPTTEIDPDAYGSADEDEVEWG